MGASAVRPLPTNAPITTLSPTQLTGGPNEEKQRSTVCYVVGIVCSVGFIFLLYHASSVQKGTSSALAGLLAPAGIMISYLVWVVYSTRANRQRTALLAAALAPLNNPTAAQPSVHTVINVLPDNVSISSQASNLSSRDLTNKKLSAVPGRVHSSSMNRSTDNLNRTGGRHHSLDRPFNTLSTVPVHQSNTNLAASSSRPHHRSAANVQRQTVGRSTLHLNNTRQLAAAVATLPSYRDAVNRNNWVLDKNHSMELSGSKSGK